MINRLLLLIVICAITTQGGWATEKLAESNGENKRTLTQE